MLDKLRNSCDFYFKFVDTLWLKLFINYELSTAKSAVFDR